MKQRKVIKRNHVFTDLALGKKQHAPHTLNKFKTTHKQDTKVYTPTVRNDLNQIDEDEDSLLQDIQIETDIIFQEPKKPKWLNKYPKAETQTNLPTETNVAYSYRKPLGPLKNSRQEGNKSWKIKQTKPHHGINALKSRTLTKKTKTMQKEGHTKYTNINRQLLLRQRQGAQDSSTRHQTMQCYSRTPQTPHKLHSTPPMRQ